MPERLDPAEVAARIERRKPEWAKFVRVFRERNQHLPEVREALWMERHRNGELDFPFEPPRPEPESEYPDLYFIGSEDGPIKIGISVNPARRLRGLQTGYPFTLTLMATIPGGALLEPEYHQRFAAHRLQGEWFNPAPDLLAEINRLRG